MKTKDILTIATTALGTATMTGTDTNPTAATIAKPKLVANGIEVTLSAADGREFKAGDQPEFELRAVNTLKEPSQAAICATLYAERPQDLMSRMIIMPSELWRQEFDFALKANETKVVTLAARTNLPANSSISVSLSQVVQAAANPGNAPATPLRLRGADGIVAMRFSTVPPAAKTASTVPAVGKAAVIAASR